MSRRLATVLALAVVVPASVLVAAPAAEAPSAPPRCLAAGLVVWLDTHGGHAMGSTYYGLEFTNRSARRCSLFGYPGVSAVGARGIRLGRPAARNPAYAPMLVVLPQGATATAMLQITSTANFPPAVCRATIAAGLRVYPPGARSSKLVPFPFSACSRTAPTCLTVQALQPST